MGRHSVKGVVFNIQRYSIHDGPGIRTTVFMKGCPLKCEWCSNPESQETYAEIIISNRSCIKCGKCLESCSRSAIVVDELGIRVDRGKCNLCMECAKVCPSEAIQNAGRVVDVDEILEEVRRDRLFYENSGGGVTVSGGEPLMQWKFTQQLIKRCRLEKIHTALDTSGYASWDVIKKVIKYVDLVLYDLKVIDSKRHNDRTGVSNKLILVNAERVALQAATWLRFPVIPGFNDGAADIKDMAKFAAKIPFEKVSLLGYHSFGEQKYEKLGRKYTLHDLSCPTNDRLEQVGDVFRSYGLRVTIGN